MVMPELMSKTARMLSHARHWVLGFGANDAAFTAFARHWDPLDRQAVDSVWTLGFDSAFERQYQGCGFEVTDLGIHYQNTKIN